MDGISRLGRLYGVGALLDSDYLLYFKSRISGGLYQQATVKFLRSPPAVFSATHQIVGSFSLMDEELELIKRIDPLTVEEAEDSIDFLEIEEVYKLKKYRLLPTLYIAENRWAEALACYDEGIREVPEIRSSLRSSLKRGRKKLLGKMDKSYLEQGREP